MNGGDPPLAGTDNHEKGPDGDRPPSGPLLQCDRCEARRRDCLELGPGDAGGALVRDSKTSAPRGFIACPRCALVLASQAARSNRRLAASNIRARARGAGQARAVATVLDAIGQVSIAVLERGGEP